MLKLNFYSMVREFMTSSGQTGQMVTPEVIDLRNKLFAEEVAELDESVSNADRVGQLDAICDTIYILVGTAVTYMDPVIDERLSDALRLSMKGNDTKGRLMLLMSCYNQMQYSVSALDHVMTISKNLGFSTPQIVEGFKRVHQSNMTKFCNTKREANDTMLKYLAETIECTWVERGGKFVVIRDDGKILKSVYYKPVILEDLV